MEEPYWGGTLDATCEDKEGAWGAFQGFLAAYEYSGEDHYLQWARHACDVVLSYLVVWDIPLPAGRLADHGFKTRGWTGVSPQNQHLDVFGVVIAPAIFNLGLHTDDPVLVDVAKLMFRSCGQMIAPDGQLKGRDGMFGHRIDLAAPFHQQLGGRQVPIATRVMQRRAAPAVLGVWVGTSLCQESNNFDMSLFCRSMQRGLLVITERSANHATENLLDSDPVAILSGLVGP